MLPVVVLLYSERIQLNTEAEESQKQSKILDENYNVCPLLWSFIPHVLDETVRLSLIENILHNLSIPSPS